METKMPYMDGFCPQCDTEIKIRDVKGRFSTLKHNHTEADMYFDRENGPTLKVRTLICKACVKNPNPQVIMDAITHEGSQATIEPYRSYLKNIGLPTRIVECVR